MSYLISLLINAIAVLLSGYIVPGVTVSSFGTSLIVAFVLGLLNVIIRPILAFFALPITFLTLGLFSLVINVLILYMVDALVPGFKLGGFWSALLFSIILSVVSTLLGYLIK